MVAAHREIERKYDVDRAARVPSVTKLPGVVRAADPVELHLAAEYFDTPELALTAAGITLRRRSGGDDDGWHLKRPAGGDREELRASVGPEAMSVPEQLHDAVRVHTRDKVVRPVATLTTRRIVHRLLDEHGVVLAEVCDDQVNAESGSDPGSVTLSSWREWEIELVEGDRSLLDAADSMFRSAGGQPAGGVSKLARALTGRVPGGREMPDRAPSKAGPAGVVVLEYLRLQVEQLKARDPQVRADEPDAVHKMRVATRRVRSALASFRPLLAREVTESLRGELKWLAGVLGDARDAEVQRDRLTGMLADEPAELEPGALAQRIDTALGQRYRIEHDRVMEVLNSPRYFRLLDRLDDLVYTPAWMTRAEQPARDVLPPRVRKEWRRVRRRVTAAEQASTPAEREGRLHEVRKSARRLRYACEALTPIFGPPAKNLAKAAERLQEILGEYQDGVVSQQLLRQLATHTALEGDHVLIYGRLHAREQEHADRARARYRNAWNHLSAKKRRRWTKR